MRREVGLARSASHGEGGERRANDIPLLPLLSPLQSKSQACMAGRSIKLPMPYISQLSPLVLPLLLSHTDTHRDAHTDTILELEVQTWFEIDPALKGYLVNL